MNRLKVLIGQLNIFLDFHDAHEEKLEEHHAAFCRLILLNERFVLEIVSEEIEELLRQLLEVL